MFPCKLKFKAFFKCGCYNCRLLPLLFSGAERPLNSYRLTFRNATEPAKGD